MTIGWNFNRQLIIIIPSILEVDRADVAAAGTNANISAIAVANPDTNSNTITIA